MKIAFTTSGSDLNAPLDRRFGRSPKFLLFETECEKFEVFDNQQNMNAAQGAGIQSAEKIARLGAAVLVTGHCGPKAFRVLSAAGIKIFTSDSPSVSSALDQYRQGKLTALKSADVEGHEV